MDFSMFQDDAIVAEWTLSEVEQGEQIDLPLEAGTGAGRTRSAPKSSFRRGWTTRSTAPSPPGIVPRG